ncbi:hypothetical protein PENSPDRAFT_371331 [Peniophora sp. CONT]|nr:hypothetical protein PENSPDRAFT_371331 [Peniophora sp. CONT]
MRRKVREPARSISSALPWDRPGLVSITALAMVEMPLRLACRRFRADGAGICPRVALSRPCVALVSQEISLARVPCPFALCRIHLHLLQDMYARKLSRSSRALARLLSLWHLENPFFDNWIRASRRRADVLPDVPLLGNSSV